MNAILNVVFPVFGLMLAGYLVGRAGLLGEDSGRALNGFVYYVALPALFFGSMAEVPLNKIFNWPLILAFGGGTLITFLLAIVVALVFFRGRFGEISMHGLTAIFSNTGYMGVPLLQIAFGQEGVLAAVITTVITAVVVISIGVILLELDRHKDSAPLVIARNASAGLAKNPLILSALAGILYSASGLPLPLPIATFMELAGNAAAPAALFAIGLFMVGKSLTEGMVEVVWISSLKLLVMPLITAWLAYSVLGMQGVDAKAAIIQAALPTGALMFVLAQQYGVYVQRATSVILVSTVLSVLSLSALFVLLGVE
ncbi:AEC family transporter [Fodinicurvata fenggangensis]|uniref:AEC family transporter n=1 Tax=Fodinicurvata fenggangensis TaxID=1121830 RepID=UPI00047D4C03|nr:AEC family transporter [Fodinicurvata fenggangensis]